MTKISWEGKQRQKEGRCIFGMIAADAAKVRDVSQRRVASSRETDEWTSPPTDCLIIRSQLFAPRCVREFSEGPRKNITQDVTVRYGKSDLLRRREDSCFGPSSLRCTWCVSWKCRSKHFTFDAAASSIGGQLHRLHYRARLVTTRSPR